MIQWQVPTIEGIQRTTALVALAAATAILIAAFPGAALGCLLGAGLMMLNLYVLSLIAKLVIAIAQRHGGATLLGLLAAPLKLLLLFAAVYLLIGWGRVNVLGFVAGSLTQLAAIFIEIWRVSARRNLAEGNEFHA